jgi:dihydrofolate synthase / folylpolyglutamate synthase
MRPRERFQGLPRFPECAPKQVKTMSENTAAAPRRTKRASVVVESPPASVEPGTPGTYTEALRYLLDRVDLERTRQTRAVADQFKLDRMHVLMEQLGNPHQAVRFVHVAGTKGKGSTCEMTASCLEACGYTVGIYTSPHLVDIRERIRINRKMVSHADFTRLVGRVREAAAAVEAAHGAATFFELVTAMAFLHFAEQAVDIAVIEVGLGGRLDSTNVITPEVAAVTSISLDHTQILGDTVELIAREKAGIFKPGVPAVTVAQKPGVVEAMREVAGSVGCVLQVVGQEIDFSVRFENSPGKGPHARVCLETPRNTFEHLRVPLRGEHQATNCGLALAILDKLAERGFCSPESRVTVGLEQTELPGRLELAWGSPRIILDGAHNEDSVRCLMRAVGAHVPYDSMVVVFGCCADKDIGAMLSQISLGADKVIFTKSSTNPRAADPRELHKKFVEKTGKMSQIAKDLPEALKIAERAVGRDDIICVTGSFYLVGEAKKYLQGQASKKGGSRP